MNGTILEDLWIEVIIGFVDGPIENHENWTWALLSCDITKNGPKVPIENIR